MSEPRWTRDELLRRSTRLGAAALLSGEAANALLRAGWSKADIKPGTQVTVSGFLARAGGSVGNAYQVRLADGRDLFAASSLKDAADAK